MQIINLAKHTACILDGSTLKLTGTVNANSIGKILQKKNKKILLETITNVDCHAIKQADSSCLALFVYIQSQHQEVVFINLPEQLIVLAKLYDLDGVLNLNTVAV